MSTLAITALIILVLGIIVGNLLLLKKSAKFDIRKKDDTPNKDEDENKEP